MRDPSPAARRAAPAQPVAAPPGCGAPGSLCGPRAVAGSGDGTSTTGGEDFTDKVPVELVREVGKIIISMGVKILLIKMGHRGAYLLTGNITSLNKEAGVVLDKKRWNNREILCNAYRVDSSRPVSATGAGDTAAAAFLTAVLNGDTPEMAIRYAAMAGRESLYCENIFEEIDNWKQLAEKIRTEQNELIG